MQEKRNKPNVCVCVDIATKGRSVQREREKMSCRNAAIKNKMHEKTVRENHSR